MLTTAFNSIRDEFKRHFPNLKIFLNWPTPAQRVQYPYLTIITANQNQEAWGEQYLNTINRDGKKFQVYNIGEWRCRLDISYFASPTEDLNSFIDVFNATFYTGARDNLSNRNLIIEFGDQYYERLNLKYLSYLLEQQPYPLQTGSGRRAIFQCMASIPDLTYQEIPVMTEPKLDPRSEVSVNPDVSEVT